MSELYHLHSKAVRSSACVLLALCGVLLGFAGSLLYESEEKKLEDKFIRWWTNTNDRHQSLAKQFIASTLRWAALQQKFLDRFFGTTLVSLRGISVFICSSLCFSYCSMVLAGLFLNHLLDIQKSAAPRFPLSYLDLFIYLALGFAPLGIRGNVLIGIWVGVVIAKTLYPPFYFGTVIAFASGPTAVLKCWFILIATLTVILAPDFLWLIINRYVLVLLARAGMGWTALLSALFANGLLLVALLWIPVKGVDILSRHYPAAAAVPFSLPLLLSYIFNTFDICFALFAAIAFGFILAYRFVVWPTLDRTLYNFANITISQRRGLLWGTAASLIGLAWKVYPY